jgi:hypothetical protein
MAVPKFGQPSEAKKRAGRVVASNNSMMRGFTNPTYARIDVDHREAVFSSAMSRFTLSVAR